MTATATPGAPSPFRSLPNWRDLGYWPAADGKIVRPEMIYRTTEFLHTSDEDIKAVGELGLATIVDLRTTGERAACPDPVYPGIGPLWLNILEDSPEMGGANPAQFISDPAAIKSLTVDFARKVMIQTYRELVTSDSALKRYREFYILLLDDDVTPTAFHCTTGKDRTGWLAAGFLSLMGVSAEDVYADYLLTNARLLPALAPILDKLTAAGADKEALTLVLGVDASYLDEAFAALTQRWGTLENYFAAGLGIDAAGQQALRDRYLIDPA
ncbi:putative protein-tyrosine-phosphatase [Gordonia hirsuta DSM 44140 = NBRC 16056]|uniref:Tyrosine specific protein phosphatases domain-containing protein n=1 Tax=Gordonia hirsuta DSM 44140 = NBRC 16056 TaxID=1121927 RepID=L7LAC9_9ACTN|nr:tyrosine-protein phosphatase [Gordonia hirsuta]GAC56968.1 putative protein-tyrosine-phosphatase [Gordonia hirsuta DSM 44140 = NBRC 16056]